MVIKLLKIFFLVGLGLVGGVFINETDNVLPDKINKILNKEKNLLTLEASGRTEFFLEDNDHHIDPEIFGTPENPLKVDLLPLWDRSIGEDGLTYRTKLSQQNASKARAEVFGTIKVKAQDLSPVYHPNSEDKAELEANFEGPNGENFRVVLTRLVSKSPSVLPVDNDHFYGGVTVNQIPQYSFTPDSKIISYLTVRGAGNLYRDGELIDENRLISMTVFPGFTNDLVVHLVLPSTAVSSEGDLFSDNLKTGIFTEDGKEQNFFHINFYENVKLTGNKFLN